MKYTKTCECCWNKITAYTHKLNAWHVDMVEKLYNYWMKNKKPAISSELNLTPVEYSCFAKARHFGIIAEYQGGWVPTRKAVAFLKWEIKIPNRVASFGNRTLPMDHEAWKTDKKGWKLVSVEEVKKDYKRKQAQEYKEEKGTSWLFSY